MRHASTKIVRLLPAVLLAAAAALPAPPAAAQLRRVNSGLPYVPGSMGIPQPEPRVTLSMKQKSLPRILAEMLGKQTGYKYAIRAGDTLGQLYDLDVKQMPVSQALNLLLSQDKNREPLVWSFSMSPTGEGMFNIDRELINIGEIEGQNVVSLSNARLTKVLPLVFKMMKVQGVVEPDVPAVPISLQLRPEKWDTVLPLVMLEAYKQEPGLTYTKSGDSYVVTLHKTPVTGSTGVRRVKIAVTKTPLADALAQLFQGSTWKYEIASGVNKDLPVTYVASNEAEMGALTSILRQASAGGKQVTYREGKGVVYIEEGPLPGEFKANAKKGVGPQTTSLSFTQKKITDVVKLFGPATGAMVRVAPNVPDLPVSFKVENGTTEDFLQELVRTAQGSIPNLTYRMTGENSYVVELSK